MLIIAAEPVAPVAPAVVRFDADRAAALAHALHALAEALDRSAVTETSRYASTTADWAGFTRRWFDHHHHGLVVELRQAAASAREEAALVTRPPAARP
jgi:hypothetical protein